MRYAIAFKDLPFEPEERQVIYVENLFDERINAIIKDHYESLKRNFKRADLDFVYLPMFFNDEEIKEKVLYYAPYLTSEIMEKIELRSSYLLGYMSHIENKERIKPSFLYNPQKDGDEWVFQGMTIDLGRDENKAVSLRLSDIISDIEEDLSPQINLCIVNEECSSVKACKMSPKPQAEYAPISTPISTWDKLKNGFHKLGRSAEKQEVNNIVISESRRPTRRIELTREESPEDFLRELEEIVKKLRLIGVAPAAIHEAIEKMELLSRLYITDNLSIFLPDYNNIEIDLTPLYKAVYMLFLNHPEGIILKRLEEHHSELLNYYRQASGKDEIPPRMIESVKRLETYGNYLNKVITKIRKAFESSFDEHLAKNYIIAGKPGEPFKISLDRDLLVFEDDYE